MSISNDTQMHAAQWTDHAYMFLDYIENHINFFMQPKFFGKADCKFNIPTACSEHRRAKATFTHDIFHLISVP